MMIFTRERRRGWAYLMARVPHVKVRRVLMEHEVEEVLADPRTGHDHYTLAIMLGQQLGLSRNAMVNARPLPSTRAALAGWINLARDCAWLEAFGGYSVAEWVNMDRLCPEGGLATRRVKKWEAELGFKAADMPSQVVHTTADDDHSAATFQVLERYADSDMLWEGICDAAEECMDYWQVFWRGLTEAMAAASPG